MRDANIREVMKQGNHNSGHRADSPPGADFAPPAELQAGLRTHLARQQAPEALWGQVRQRMARNQVRTSDAEAGLPLFRLGPVLAVAAALLVAVGGYFALHQTQTLETIATSALEYRPEQLDFQSSDAEAIRRWLIEETGVDVPLPPQHNDMVRLLGANAVPSPTVSGAKIAEISYRVGDQGASLIVANDPSANPVYPMHQAAEVADRAARVTSWSLAGQNFAVAWTEQGAMEAACLLCHQGSAPAVN